MPPPLPRRARPALLVTALLPAILAAAAEPAPPGAPDLGEPRIRGVVVTCPRWGPIWGSPEMAASLAEIRELGANWVAIHPYGWVKRDGVVEWRPAASLDFLDRAVALAAEAGLEMFWKPHLGYWGEFSWRGDIRYDDEAAWARFFRDYEAFIVDQAAFAESRGVRLFAVGTELDATLHHEREWRSVIAAVRRVYSGRLLYAANWNQLAAVPFWDAVDVLGVHAYFPLAVAGPDGAPAAPGRAELAAAWDGPLAELEALARRHRKPVVLAEIGYNVHAAAAVEPWAYRVEDTPANRDLRRRLMEVALERLETADFVAGMFWWKWMPGPTHRRRNFSLRDEEARAALARYWRPGALPAALLSTADR